MASGLSRSAPDLKDLRQTRPVLPRPVRSGRDASKLPAVGGAAGKARRKSGSQGRPLSKRVTIVEPEEPSGEGEDVEEEASCGSRPGRLRGAFNVAKPRHPAFAESEWENELARSILVLYGSAMGSGEDLEGAENDFAIDRDAVRVPKDKVTKEEVKAGQAHEAEDGAGQGRDVGQLQTAPLSVVFHSFRRTFGRGIIARSGLDAWMGLPERARADRPR